MNQLLTVSVNSCTSVKSVKVEQTENKVGLNSKGLHCSRMLTVAAYGSSGSGVS